VPANPLVTPPHIVPEWYFLPFYAILRSIPDKLLGVAAMLISILILIALPFTIFPEVRSMSFRPLSKTFFWLFVLNCLILGWIGGSPMKFPYLEIGKVATVTYFAYFFVLYPSIVYIENWFWNNKNYYRPYNIKEINQWIKTDSIRFPKCSNYNKLTLLLIIGWPIDYSFKDLKLITIEKIKIFYSIIINTPQTTQGIIIIAFLFIALLVGLNSIHEKWMNYHPKARVVSDKEILNSIKNYYIRGGFLKKINNKITILNMEYIPILIAITLSLLLAVIIFGASYAIVPKSYDLEKISPYECGFDPFEDTRAKFDVRFYLVSILFIIFDLEVTFLFPWAISLTILNNAGYFSMILFLIILTVGFAYEWGKGALNWKNIE